MTEAKATSKLVHLRSVLGLDDVPPAQTVQLIKKHLRQRIHTLAGEYEVLDSPITRSATVLRPAFECLLHLTTPKELKDGPYLGVEPYERRRLYAIRTLDLAVSPRNFRLPGHEETQLMTFLARRLFESIERHDGLEHQSVELLGTLDDDGAPATVTVIESVRVIRPGVDRATFPVLYMPDPRPDVCRVEPVHGLTGVETDWRESYSRLQVTLLFEPGAAGQTINYVFRLVFDTDKPLDQSFYHVRSVHYDRVKVQLIFAAGRRPMQVWWFDRLPTFDAPGEPTSAATITSHNGSTFTRQFYDCPGGLAYGFGWEWGDGRDG
ncbi:hypothetical protein ACIPX0_38330 [Streptomyces sp. NPDC090075]|uniref:hypothetical protein n=1 Tax=Streptomyces sp. NPDC090075 TaxID=3365937 RepID=UPI00382B6319